MAKCPFYGDERQTNAQQYLYFFIRFVNEHMMNPDLLNTILSHLQHLSLMLWRGLWIYLITYNDFQVNFKGP